MKPSRLLSSFLLIALASSPASGNLLFENSSHDMTAGSFGVAFLRGGNIHVRAPNSTPQTLLAGLNATQIVAADTDGDGRDELAFVTGGSLRIHDFDTGTTSAATGGSINDITAGRFTAGDTHDTIYASTGTLFTYNAPTTTWTNRGGSGIRSLSIGNYVTGNGVDETVVINTSNQPYIYTPGTGYTGPEGGGYRVAVGGNISNAAAGDEFWLTLQSGNAVFYTENPAGTQNNVNTSGSANDLHLIFTADTDNNAVDEGWVIGGNSALFRYIAGTGYSQTFASNNANWISGVAGDLNGDGTDEIYALRDGPENQLWVWDPASSSAFALAVPEPGTLPLFLSGALLLLRRLQSA